MLVEPREELFPLDGGSSVMTGGGKDEVLGVGGASLNGKTGSTAETPCVTEVGDWDGEEEESKCSKRGRKASFRRMVMKSG